METEERAQPTPAESAPIHSQTADRPAPKKNHVPLKGNRKYLLIGAAVLVLAVCVLIASMTGHLGQKNSTKILTNESLEQIIEVSRLSTYGAAYNGIAKVTNPEDPEKIDYYVSYESDVKVSMDLDRIKSNIDSENSIITITLPKMDIQVAVDIGSLDYIFLEEDAETPTVAQQAYSACIADAEAECEAEKDIFLLAQKNAEKTVKALLEPLLSASEQEYTLQIEWEVQ